MSKKRFAYPIFVSLFLLPTVYLEFGQVQIIASFVMGAHWGISAFHSGWALSDGNCLAGKVVALVLLVLSSRSPAVQALEMQQMSTLVCVLIAAGSFSCLLVILMFLQESSLPW